MKQTKVISKAVIKRLPRYRRYLGELKKRGVEKISSKDLSELIGYTASQIRQDLNNFGGFGQQGYGYSVENLYKEISNILGLNKEYKTVIVGYGRLGQAMASYIDKNEKQFRIAGIFDVSDKVVNEVFKNAQVYAFNDLKEFVVENDIEIAVITVPREKGQVVADTLVEAGIKGIWNFSSVDLELPDNVCVENVHMSDSLHALAYYMKDK
ncbi:MAG: redox-sensing transcriptional repressor Rex [Firmicutes bacterium]|nr:redox-sensing transcriptional repressor Rex [Clostridiales bacterium]MBR3183235.1 redox-sensing transcriptional repressor Rex [Bacillota bacterium]MBR3260644.1 redox-sensing transcriptional repressor Rex [Bacillota bacterium]MBR3375059.1 redox-sensing transcriptional repressor Rex [Bacillota bacterium]MBR4023820.1 redox-sensing transcriptional repressor Rex [Bacillota bacterium]